MSDKALRKRQHILGQARKVFADKGYKAVTMKDIVDACGISRGGLYLYFPDVREIFLAVLEAERPPENGEAVDRVLQGDASVADMLALYLREQIRPFLEGLSDLGIAEAEFFSVYEVGENEVHPLRKRFEEAVRMVSGLISLGIRSGEFVVSDAEGTARGMMYELEGVRALGRTGSIERDAAERELDRMIGNIRKG